MSCLTPVDSMKTGWQSWFKLAMPPCRETAVLVPVLLTAVLTSRQGLGHVLGVVLASIAFGALFPIYGWALSRRSLLGLRAGTLEYRGLVRTRVIAARGESVAIVRASRQDGAVWWQVWTGRQWTKVFDERAWSPDDLSQLASAVQATVTEDRDELDTPAFARRYPGAMPTYAQHPRVSAAVLFVVLALVVAWLGDYEILSTS